MDSLIEEHSVYPAPGGSASKISRGTICSLARDLIAEFATNSRKAAFPREAGGDRRHVLAAITHTTPHPSLCSETAMARA